MPFSFSFEMSDNPDYVNRIHLHAPAPLYPAADFPDAPYPDSFFIGHSLRLHSGQGKMTLAPPIHCPSSHPFVSCCV